MILNDEIQRQADVAKNEYVGRVKAAHAARVGEIAAGADPGTANAAAEREVNAAVEEFTAAIETITAPLRTNGQT